MCMGDVIRFTRLRQERVGTGGRRGRNIIYCSEPNTQNIKS